jgi:hypothetical protein
MYKQQSYSYGLLYSIAPSSFYSLHLLEHEGKDSFDWQANNLQNGNETLTLILLNHLKTIAFSLGIIGSH